MLQKGSADYRKAQIIANNLQSLASNNRWSNNSYFEIAMAQFSKIVYSVIDIEGFAGEVAKTVENSMGGNYVARCSSKQAWIIACAAVENGKEFDFINF